MNMRIGHGYDVHRLVEGRRCIIGGVDIPFELGLDGHSDADVLTHAVMDALLGALALGDIGKHFPDTDPAYKGADSLALLRHVSALIREKAGRSAISTQPYSRRRPSSRRISCRCAKTWPPRWRATWTAFPSRRRLRKSWASPGAKQGIAAHCVCLLEKL